MHAKSVKEEFIVRSGYLNMGYFMTNAYTAKSSSSSSDSSSYSSTSGTDDGALGNAISSIYDSYSLGSFDSLGSFTSIDDNFYYEADESAGYTPKGEGYTASYLYDEFDGSGVGKLTQTYAPTATGESTSRTLAMTTSYGLKLSESSSAKSSEKETATSYSSSESSSMKLTWSEGSKTTTKTDDASWSITASDSSSSSENYNTGASTSSSKESLSVTYTDGMGYKLTYKYAETGSSSITSTKESYKESGTISITCSTPDKESLTMSGKFDDILGTYTVTSLTVKSGGDTEKLSNTLVDGFTMPFSYSGSAVAGSGSMQDTIVSLIGVYLDMAYSYDND